MKNLFIECNMGASGDMLMGAMYSLLSHEQEHEFLNTINGMGIKGLKITPKQSVKCGIYGVHMSVTVNGEEEHSHDVDHEHEHEHGHDHDHEHGHNHDHEHGHDHEHEHEHAHSHDHGHDEDGHSHGHEHSEHEHSHEQDHGHSHDHGQAHSHNGFGEIVHIIDTLSISDKVKSDAKAVYKLIADAESKAHNKPVTQVHFHEVGELDAVADIVSCCILVAMLGVDKIIASPINVGSGFVKCAHGILPVPAPATADILRGIPMYSGMVKGELCTPTGAALLKHFACEFKPMPIIAVENIGYGMGSKDFEVANCVRAYLYNEVLSAEKGQDDIVSVCCNVDDMTGEEVSFACDKLFASGALDVFTTPIYMKKNRPAFMITALCKPDMESVISDTMLMHTSTLGVRKSCHSRYVLDREFRDIDTKYGKVTIKSASINGEYKYKPEFDDIVKLANEYNIPIATVMQDVTKTGIGVIGKK